ncbi:unnamed protein product [Pleuronectes platessa]|uniref:Uncharacterized protein n=1 Tax=Pleuronectes platessa TaxID=8262 RepID=A0A9N7VVF1_PLEPL|nr:unnamed protein product [Pleuronectes platessa]
MATLVSMCLSSDGHTPSNPRAESCPSGWSATERVNPRERVSHNVKVQVKETGTGAQLLWEINGAARCRDSEEGDHPGLLFTAVEEDKVAVRGARDRREQGRRFIMACRI